MAPDPRSRADAPRRRGDAHAATLAAHAPQPVAAAEDSFAAGFDRFEVRRELGRGGMGIVLAAYDPTLQREVAIKLMRMGPATEAERARFVQEARITGRLSHPGIPPIYELGLAPGNRPYFAMKVVRGQALSQRLEALRNRPRALRRASPFPLSQRIDVLLKVGEALELAHAQGVVHRDLKPENVMVGEFGEVQLMDWGLAKPIGTATPAEASAPAARGGLTQDGYVAGTPAYMAPEQARGELAAIDGRTDVFALGALLYEMLSLSAPYPHRDVEEAIDAAAAGDWLPIPQRIARDRRQLAAPPRELVAIAHRAMDPSPQARYQDVGLMLADLRAYLAHEPVSASPDALGGRLAKLVQRHPRGTLGLSSGLVVAVLMALLSEAWRRAETEQLRGAMAVAEARARAAEAAQAQQRAQRAEEDSAAAGRRADELGKLALRQLSEATRAIIAEFDRRWDHSRAGGEDHDQFFGALSPAEVDRYLAAFDDLFRARGLVGEASTSQEYYQRALLRQARGDEAGALADYDQAHQLAPEDATVLNNRGVIRQSLGQDAAARADFDAALALDPEHSNALANRAALRRGQGDRAGARADLERALARNPHNALALGARANLRQAEGDLEGAIADYDRALAAAPRSAVLYSNRGAAWYARGEPARARADLDRALALNPRDVTALANRAQVRAGQGDPRGAAEDLERALAIQPDHLPALFNRGTLRLNQGELPGAISDFDRALAVQPNDVRVRANRGLACLESGRMEAALADLKRVVELQPSDARAWSNLGNAHARAGEMNAALTAMERAIALDGTLMPARLCRGEVLLLLGRLDEAAIELDRCVELDPRSAKAWSERGRLHAKRGELAAALSDLDRAVSLEPRSASILRRRGEVRHQAGQNDGAIADYLAVLELDPRAWACAANLSQLLAARGQRAEALHWLRHALQHCSDAATRPQIEAWIRQLGG